MSLGCDLENWKVIQYKKTTVYLAVRKMPKKAQKSQENSLKKQRGISPLFPAFLVNCIMSIGCVRVSKSDGGQTLAYRYNHCERTAVLWNFCGAGSI